MAIPLISVASRLVSESQGYVDFEVRLSAPSTQTVSLTYATYGGSATSIDDFDGLGYGQLAFAPGETLKTVRVGIVEDKLVEPLEYFTLQLRSPMNADIGNNDVTGMIVDNDAPAVAQPLLTISDVLVDEKAGRAYFELQLNNPGTSTVNVNFATANVSAVAGQDYEAISGVLAFAPGEVAKTIAVNLIDDTIAEGEELFRLSLSNEQGATLADAQAVAIIGASDQPTVSTPVISASDVIVSESQGYVDFEVRLSAPSTQTVSLTYATYGGSATSIDDFDGLGYGQLAFAPGETLKTVRVGIVEDKLVEPLEYFTLQLRSPMNADIGESIATATISDAGTVLLEPEASFRTLSASRFGPTANELPLEMIKFSITAYADSAHGADATADPDSNWSSVTALQVSGASFENGVYTSPFGQAVAHLYVGDVGSSRTLVVAFRGTDHLSTDFPDYAQELSLHWNRFAPLIDELGGYIARNNIDSVYVTGHSLGGAMVEYFLDSFSNLSGVDYRGFTFGSPGGGRNNSSEARLYNYEQANDPIPKLGPLVGAMSSGWIVSIDWDLPSELAVTTPLPPLGHAKATYLESMSALFDEGERLLPSNDVTLLRDLPTVASQMGNHASNVLVGDSRSELLLGFGGDDVLNGGGGDDILDGGDGTDTASYLSSYASYLLQKQAAEYLLHPKSSFPGSFRPQSIEFAHASTEISAVAEEGTDRLISIERLEFADKTFDLVNLPRQDVPAYGQQNGFLFDAVYYLLDNPGLVPTQTLATVLQHYFRTGAAQGKQPNSWFDPTYYENRWPDLTAGNFSDDILFMHYNLYGVWEGRSAGPKFDEFDGNRYLTDNPDVAAYVDANVADFLGSRTNGAIAHYVIYGQHEQRLAFDRVGQQIDLGYTINLGG